MGIGIKNQAQRRTRDLWMINHQNLVHTLQAVTAFTICPNVTQLSNFSYKSLDVFVYDS